MSYIDIRINKIETENIPRIGTNKPAIPPYTNNSVMLVEKTFLLNNFNRPRVIANIIEIICGRNAENAIVKQINMLRKNHNFQIFTDLNLINIKAITVEIIIAKTIGR